MKPVENHKDVTINERTFRIKKFDARTGAFMLLKITGMIAPLLKGVDLNKFTTITSPGDIDLSGLNLTSILSELGNLLCNLSEEDFTYIQDKCLKLCSEALPAGLTPVLAANGAFGVLNLEEDTMTVLALTVHTIMFNVQGFFSGSPLASMLGGLSITSRQG